MASDADPTAVPDDRLIAALERCFSKLVKTQEEQGDRLFHAVTALKPQALATDKKTAFWNSYMKLADDYDKEFQQKYSTDLDTALIFSGLFSAVSSAFIIEIEPQLASNYRLIIVVVQSMLYISLFTTLLAALLAVLGKQWIMYYLASGSRGTIEERGLERQCKLDGLVKWKFDAVLQMFPLLLQLSLLLFASSLSVYLWTINHAIAIIVMVLTGFGLGSYLFLLVSAMTFPDCPFQSPLAPFLIQVFSPCWKALYSLQYKLPWKYRRRLSDFKFHRPRFAPHKPVDPYAHYFFDPPSPEVPAVLWTLGTTTDPATITVAAEIGIDLQWPVQASIKTEVDRLVSTLLNACSDSYPYTLRNGMAEVAFTCGKLFGSLRLVESSNLLLTNFVSSGTPEDYFADSPVELKNVLHVLGGSPDLIRIGEMSPSNINWFLYVLLSLRGRFGSQSPLAEVKWFLDQFQAETVPSLDLPSFTNYLCCLCSFFGPVDARIMVQIDKSGFQAILMAQLFSGFRSSTMDSAVVAKIIYITAKFAEKLVGQSRKRAIFGYEATFDEQVRLTQEMSLFCSTVARVDGWLDTVVSAAKLVRVCVEYLAQIHSFLLIPPFRSNKPLRLPEFGAQAIQWIYMALEHVNGLWQENVADGEDSTEWDSNTALTVDGLLQVLACNNSLPESPTVESLHIILRALSAPTDVACTAFLVLTRAKAWFEDHNLLPILDRFSVVHHLGRVALKYPILAAPYARMIQDFTARPEWKSALFRELPTLIAVCPEPHPALSWRGELFISVIQDVWVPKFNEHHLLRTLGLKQRGLTLMALTNVWGIYDFTTTPPCTPSERFLQLVRCTVSTALQRGYPRTPPDRRYPPSIFYSRLCDALRQAATNARNVVHDASGSLDSGTSHNPLQCMADLLDSLARKLESGFAAGDQVWEELKTQLEAEINAFEESFWAEQKEGNAHTPSEGSS
ncbi:hypothetical protein B0H13DRAFT_2654280 [Mycena leptocephala]|nr:hypothetical protein B0H13DRAFT_2654280 [Mycena leptocephala]